MENPSLCLKDCPEDFIFLDDTCLNSVSVISLTIIYLAKRGNFSVFFGGAEE